MKADWLVGCVVLQFPSLCWCGDKIPLLFPVLLASAGLPKELLLSPCACSPECLLMPPCTPYYHPPIHPPIAHQNSKGPVAGCTEGGRVCGQWCGESEKVRKKKRKKGRQKERKKGWGVWICSIVCYSLAQPPMEHWESGMSVPQADFSTAEV